MKKNGFILTLICCLVIAASIGAAALLVKASPPTTTTDVPVIGNTGEFSDDPRKLDPIEDVDHDAAVQKGRLPGHEDDDINTDQNSVAYLVNREVYFDKPTLPGNIMMENTAGNQCNLKMELRLDSTGDLIYTSALLEPGECIIKDKLDVKLNKGNYNVTATILAYDFDGNEVGTYTLPVSVTVYQKLF